MGESYNGIRGLVDLIRIVKITNSTHSAGTMLEHPDTTFEAVPWWIHDLFVVVRDILRCLEYVR